jgi:hypothetical protein
MRADEGDHFLHIAARERFQFAPRQPVRIHGNAALGAAIGQAGQCAFPAHPDGQRRDFADIDIGRKTGAALCRSQRQVMLDAIALEHRRLAIVHVDWAGDGDGPLRIEQPVTLVVRDFQIVCDADELVFRHFENRSGIDCRHVTPSCRCFGHCRDAAIPRL